MVLRLLARGLLREEAATLRRLAIVTAGGMFLLLLAAMAVSGALAGLVEPIEDTVTGDARVTNGTFDLARGDPIRDHHAFSRPVREIEGTEVLPRLETMYVTVQRAGLESWGAGLMVGINTTHPAERASLSPYLVEGEIPEGVDAVDPDTGKAYTPILMGDSAAEELGIGTNGTLDPFEQPLVLSAGTQTDGSEGLGLPITIEAVVVGTFETGVDPLDTFIAYAPIESVRILEGEPANDPVANALVVHGAGQEQVQQAYEDEEDVESGDAQQYALDYFGGMLVIVHGVVGLQLALLVGLLLLWLASRVDDRMREREPALASLCVAGVPRRDIGLAYALTFTLPVAAATLVALLGAGLVALLAEPVTVTWGDASARLLWTLEAWHVAGALVIGSLVAGAASLAAARRRLSRLELHAALQES